MSTDDTIADDPHDSAASSTKLHRLIILVVLLILTGLASIYYVAKIQPARYEKATIDNFKTEFFSLHGSAELEKLVNSLVHTEGSDDVFINDFRKYLLSHLQNDLMSLDVTKIPPHKNFNNLKSSGYAYTLSPTYYLRVETRNKENGKIRNLEFLLGTQSGKLKITVLKKVQSGIIEANSIS